MPEICVVDTNVPVTANGKNHMSTECAVVCQRALKELMTSGKLLIDDRWEILSEYKDNLGEQGQPGLGDVFLKWVLTNHANPAKMEKVAVTPEPDASGRPSFKEFPNGGELKEFDPSDRVFVAVATNHPDCPPILQAADSKWLGLWGSALEKAGINVEYLCKEELQKIFDGKFG